MANNVIVYKEASNHEISPGQVVTLGEKGSFDTVTERWYFANGIPAGYGAGGGNDPNGQPGTWINIGPSDVERLPGGAVIATITWRGLKGSGSVSTSETWAIRETSYDSLANVPSAPSSAAVKARVLDIVPGLSLRGIYNQKQSRPRLNISGLGKTNPSIQSFSFPTISSEDQATIIGSAPVYCYPWGWVPYSWTQEEPIPGIFFVSAEFKFEFQKQFG